MINASMKTEIKFISTTVSVKDNYNGFITDLEFFQYDHNRFVAFSPETRKNRWIDHVFRRYDTLGEVIEVLSCGGFTVVNVSDEERTLYKV